MPHFIRPHIQITRSLKRKSSLHNLIRKVSLTTKSSPLRILFCGSDEFSCASLSAIQARRSELDIESLDVLCRPGKPTGRGLKKIREVPLKSLAQSMGLKIHERDTFTSWSIPKTENDRCINLIIAVSFGLFVPPRILNSVEYGGINVHPSLLPDLRGPAPLHHTLLRGDTESGVTLQTLDSKRFDHGKILLQNTFKVTPPESSNTSLYDSLLKQACVEGGELLVRGLQRKAYLAGHEYTPQHYSTQSNARTAHAPKITNADRMLKLDRTSIAYMVRQEKVLGRVWISVRLHTGETKRLVLSGLASLPTSRMINRLTKPSADTPTGRLNTFLGIFPTSTSAYKVPIIVEQEDERLFLPLENDTTLVIECITVEGEEKKPAKLALFGVSGLKNGSHRFVTGLGQ